MPNAVWPGVPPAMAEQLMDTAGALKVTILGMKDANFSDREASTAASRAVLGKKRV